MNSELDDKILELVPPKIMYATGLNGEAVDVDVNAKRRAAIKALITNEVEAFAERLLDRACKPLPIDGGYMAPVQNSQRAMFRKAITAELTNYRKPTPNNGESHV